MISGDGWGLIIPGICFTVEEKNGQKPQPGKLTRPGFEPRPAKEKQLCYLDHSDGLLYSYVLAGIPSSSLSVARESIVAGYVGIFGVFLGVLRFPEFRSTNTLHYNLPQFYFIYYFHFYSSIFICLTSCRQLISYPCHSVLSLCS